jgi:CheY-like chemotaxis protein
VLLVDDDTGVLEMIGETIATMGHTVLTAQDGCQALHMLIDNRSINCLFTDVVMSSSMNGVQLVAAARAVRPGLPTLLASSYARDDVRAMGEIPGDVCFIAKPYLLSDLHEHLYWGGGSAPGIPEPPSRAVVPTTRVDRRRDPSRFWLGTASRTVLLGQSWIHDNQA